MWRQYNKKKPTRLESSRDVNTPLTLTTNTGGRCNWQSPQQHLAGSPARPQSLVGVSVNVLMQTLTFNQ